MKLILPTIPQGIDGGEDSTRLKNVSKLKKDEAKKTFKELLLEDQKTGVTGKKRVKFIYNEQTMVSSTIQQELLGLRRTEAKNYPRMDKKTFGFDDAAEKSLKTKSAKSISSSVVSDLKSNIDSSLLYNIDISLKEADSQMLLSKARGEINKSTDLNEKKKFFISEKQIDNPGSLQNVKDLKSAGKLSLKNSIEDEEISGKHDFSLENENLMDESSLTALKGIQKRSLNFDLANSKDFEFSGEKTKGLKSGLKEIFKNNSIDSTNFQSLIQLYFNQIGINNSSSNNISSILLHIYSNISKFYRATAQDFSNMLDSITINSFGKGFLVNMKLYPEDLGELELILRKDGKDISLAATVLNEEAKQILMNDSENLSFYFSQQGFNLTDFNVDVRSDNNDSTENDFGEFINSNDRFSLHEDDHVEFDPSSFAGQINKVNRSIGKIVNKII
ncbi:MAG TPA: flagellar hook-length control protein FliK [Exilispira sp.]|nr:flagellar hook-length control protein FliK [Exilispira sp.]